MDNLIALGVLITLLVLVALAVLITLYVLGSLGLYSLAKGQKLEYPWLAWIPIARDYLLGELTGNKMWGLKGSKWVLALTPVLLFALDLTGIGIVLGLPLSIVYLVYFYMVLFQLFKKYRPANADLYLITSIIFNFMIPIWYFIIRNDHPKLEQPENLVDQDNHYIEIEDNSEDVFNYRPYQDVRDHLESLGFNNVPNKSNSKNNDKVLKEDNKDLYDITLKIRELNDYNSKFSD